MTPSRLENLKKDLTRQKDALLREGKAKTAAMENVKTQIDNFMKVSTLSYSPNSPFPPADTLPALDRD